MCVCVCVGVVGGWCIANHIPAISTNRVYTTTTECVRVNTLSLVRTFFDLILKTRDSKLAQLGFQF